MVNPTARSKQFYEATMHVAKANTQCLQVRTVSLPRSDGNGYLNKHRQGTDIYTNCTSSVRRSVRHERRVPTKVGSIGEDGRILSPPPTEDIRAPGNGGVSVEDGKENVGIINWALNTASFWKLKFANSISVDAQPAYNERGTTPTSEFAK